jgi:hypothetical protein
LPIIPSFFKKPLTSPKNALFYSLFTETWCFCWGAGGLGVLLVLVGQGARSLLGLGAFWCLVVLGAFMPICLTGISFIPLGILGGVTIGAYSKYDLSLF